MFLVSGDLVRLDPGTVRSAYGRLTTWAWTSKDPGTASARDEPLAHGLAPGKYSLAGHYASGDHEVEEALEPLRQFFLGADTSAEAFLSRRFIGLRYSDAVVLRDARYRLWTGAVDSPPWEFAVEP
jgi:hypothetical protein